MGIHAGVPKKAVTSSSVRKRSCTHFLAHVEQDGHTILTLHWPWSEANQLMINLQEALLHVNERPA